MSTQLQTLTQTTRFFSAQPLQWLTFAVAGQPTFGTGLRRPGLLQTKNGVKLSGVFRLSFCRLFSPWRFCRSVRDFCRRARFSFARLQHRDNSAPWLAAHTNERMYGAEVDLQTLFCQEFSDTAVGRFLSTLGGDEISEGFELGSAIGHTVLILKQTPTKVKHVGALLECVGVSVSLLRSTAREDVCSSIFLKSGPQMEVKKNRGMEKRQCCA